MPNTNEKTIGEASSSLQSIETLRELRHMSATERAVSDVERMVSSVDRISNPEGLAHLDSRIFVMDLPLQYANMVALESLGCNAKEIADLFSDGGGRELTVSRGNESLRLRPLGDRALETVFDKYPEPGEDASIDSRTVRIRDAIIERFKQSPAHRAVHDLAEQPHSTNYLETKPFNITEDRTGTLCFLYDAGLLPRPTTEQLFSSETDPIALLAANDRLDVQYADDSVYYTIGDDFGKTTLQIDADVAMAKVSFSSTEDYYPEHASNAHWSETIPFIDTECAAELFAALEGVGLTFSKSYQNEMIRTSSADRYGGVYTQISREVAKWINREGRMRVENIFVRKDDESEFTADDIRTDTADGERHSRDWLWQSSRKDQMSDEELAQEDAYVRDHLLSIDVSTMGEAASTIINLVQGAISRGVGSSGRTNQLTVTKSDVSMLDGACFDVATYYIGATEQPAYMQKVIYDGVPMLAKTHGKHTFLLQDEAILNGVVLPRGSLMKRGDDDGWAMLRLTPFCFDKAVDQLATGSELEKAYVQESKIIRRLGGVTLAHLVESIR